MTEVKEERPIVKVLVDQIASMDVELIEFKRKYEKLLSFVKEISIITNPDIITKHFPKESQEILKEIGELK